MFIFLVFVTLCSLDAVKASQFTFYASNNSNVEGAGNQYTQYLTRFDVNEASGSVTTQLLPARLNQRFESESGGALCGDFYIAGINDGVMATGVAIVSVSSTFVVEPQGNLLFHYIACSDKANTFYAVVNDPFATNSSTFQVVLYNWTLPGIQQTLVSWQMDLANFQFDSVFSMDDERTSVFWLDSASSGNSGSINVVSFATGKSKKYDVSGVIPYQLFGFSATTLQGQGAAYEVNGDGTEVIKLYFGSYSCSGSSCAFTSAYTPADLDKVWMQGEPYAFSKINDRLISMPQTVADVSLTTQTLTVFQLSTFNVLLQKSIYSGPKDEQRSLNAIAL